MASTKTAKKHMNKKIARAKAIKRQANMRRNAAKQNPFASLDNYVSTFLSDAHAILIQKETLQNKLNSEVAKAKAAFEANPSAENEKSYKVIEQLQIDLAATNEHYTNLYRTIGLVEDAKDYADKMEIIAAGINHLISIQTSFDQMHTKILTVMHNDAAVEEDTKMDASQADFEPATANEEAETTVGQLEIPESQHNVDGEIDIDVQDLPKDIQDNLQDTVQATTNEGETLEVKLNS